MPRDRLVIGFGDSFTSGEGNPERRALFSGAPWTGGNLPTPRRWDSHEAANSESPISERVLVRNRADPGDAGTTVTARRSVNPVAAPYPNRRRARGTAWQAVRDSRTKQKPR